MNFESLVAGDLKTADVVTVPPSMPISSLARLLADRGISSAPVTTPEGKLLGIVTEADLLRRLAGREDAPVGWLRSRFRDVDKQAESFARTHGMVAQDVMTKDVLTVAPDATAERCAQLMEEHGIKRLPVVSEGRLVGMVSRADLLRAIFEPPARVGAGPGLGNDATIRSALRRELRSQAWASSNYTSSVVKDGVVTLNGFVRSEAVRRALLVLAGRIEGVIRVEDQLMEAPFFLPGEYI